ncbi:MAG: cytochrome d ubiquinol oxidase subunit II [Desulfomicrobiaceae bacterium]|nr:cytochrome d ubiquinol oxidase subunit II [Desulfomicrobiaceae bacterium]
MLETIWFLVWGILWSVYFVLDGFDLGLGALLPVLGKTDTDRRTILNAMGPFWDGNEVWLITAGGVTFAAFPTAYAIMFSSLYTPLMLLLIALIIRGVAFEFRHLHDCPRWRALWDWAMVIGSFLPALLLGVAFANIFQGLPLDKQGIFQGNFFSLLNPYGLAGGVLFVLLFAMHGCLWLALRTHGELHDRAVAMAGRIFPILAAVIALFVVLTVPLTGLLRNYLTNPLLLVLLAIPVGCLVLVRKEIQKGAGWKAWALSAGLIAGLTLFGVTGLYPNILPSSLDPAASVTAFNAASSTKTLSIMLLVALIFVPVVALYQVWMYRTFSHKMDERDLSHDNAY